jgi:VWFA-related protein
MRSTRTCLFLLLTSLLAPRLLSQASPAPAPSAATPAPAVPAQAPQTAPAPPVRPAAPGQVAAPERNPDGTYTIRRNARLVVLDVVVTDKQGEIVRDLEKSDFHVTEAKEPQAIQNFEKTDQHAAPPEDATIESTADLDRVAPRAPVNIILLDEFNTRFEDEAFARYSLKEYLKRQPDKLTVPTMLVAVSLENFTVVRDYTQNKQEIIQALDHHFTAYPWQVHSYGWVAERYGTAFLTLRRVAEAMMGHPGHKNMIWIGRGFPPLDLRAQVDAEARINNEVQNCVDILRDARVTLYTVDPAGLQVYNTYGAAAEFNDPFGGNYQFSALAKATGGRTMYGRNDVDAEIGRAARDGASFYTLTYRPTDTTVDLSKFRRIQVTVDRPGVTVTTREGYYLQRRPGRVDPKAPSRRLVQDLLSADKSNMAYDGAEVTLVTTPGDPNEFLITVGARSLGWTYATDTEPRKSQVVLLVSMYDKKNKELKREARTITASAPPTVPPTGRLELPMRMKYKLERDAKAVRARFVVRVSSTGRIGTVDYDLVTGVASMPGPEAAGQANGEAPAAPK